jgi:hypothetical protein
MKQQYGTGLLKMTTWCLFKHHADDRNSSSKVHDDVLKNNVCRKWHRWRSIFTTKSFVWVSGVSVSAQPPAKKMAGLIKKENLKKRISNNECRKDVFCLFKKG